MKAKDDSPKTRWALDKNYQPIYILNAPSGKGYFCMGCHKEKVAHRSNRIADYFSHKPHDVVYEKPCTWSDETFIHKKAIELIYQRKQVLLPRLTWENPENGDIYLIRGEEAFFAQRIEYETSYFYLDEQFELQISNQKHDVFSSVKPDLVFYDVNNKPVLFIEIAVTHKIDDEKHAKLMHMGVNTIQIFIDKKNSSLEDISKIVSSNKNTKWVFHHEQYNFKPSAGLSPLFVRNIQSVDDNQIPILTESFECRKFRIREAIRAFERFERTSGINELIEKEKGFIHSIEEQQGRFDAEFEQHQGRIFSDVERQVERIFGDEQSYVDIQISNIDQQIKKFDLEHGLAEQNIRKESDNIEQQIRDTEQQICCIEQKHIGLEERYSRKANEFSAVPSLEAYNKYITGRQAQEIEDIESTIKTRNKDIIRFIIHSKRIEKEYRSNLESTTRLLEECRKDEDNITEQHRIAKRDPNRIDVQGRVERSIAEIVESIKNGTVRTHKLERYVKETITETSSFIRGISIEYERGYLEFAADAIKNRTYKDWDRIR